VLGRHIGTVALFVNLRMDGTSDSTSEKPHSLRTVLFTSTRVKEKEIWASKERNRPLTSETWVLRYTHRWEPAKRAVKAAAPSDSEMSGQDGQTSK
jgi:hypothetical protein